MYPIIARRRDCGTRVYTVNCSAKRLSVILFEHRAVNFYYIGTYKIKSFYKRDKYAAGFNQSRR